MSNAPGWPWVPGRGPTLLPRNPATLGADGLDEPAPLIQRRCTDEGPPIYEKSRGGSNSEFLGYVTVAFDALLGGPPVVALLEGATADPHLFREALQLSLGSPSSIPIALPLVEEIVHRPEGCGLDVRHALRCGRGFL